MCRKRRFALLPELEIERVAQHTPDSCAERNPLGVDAGVTAKADLEFCIGVVERGAGLVCRAHGLFDAGLRIGFRRKFALRLVRKPFRRDLERLFGNLVDLRWNRQPRIALDFEVNGLMLVVDNEVPVGLIDDHDGFEFFRVTD